MKTGERVVLSFVGVIVGGIIFLMMPDVDGQNLFVTTFNGNIIQIMPGGLQSTDNTATLKDPSGIAFDKAGNLYVANYSGDNVIEIPPNGTNAPFADVPLDPYNLAFDRTGNLFVACAAPGNGNITEIAPNGTQTSFASGLNGPYGLAFNSAGVLFESESSSNTGAINQFIGGVKTQFSSGFGDAYGLAFDGKGNLFAAIFNSNSIVEFANNNGTLNATPTVFATGLHGPVGIVFDGTDNLFVANYSGTNITEITSQGTESTFATGFGQYSLWGLAFHPAPKLQSAYAKGSFRLNVMMASPYITTIVQMSSNLVNWTSVYTNTPPYGYTDSMPASVSRRYYRAVLDP